MKIIIFDNIFNNSEFFKITKNTKKFLVSLYNTKLLRLINKLRKDYKENLEVKIITNDNVGFIKFNDIKSINLSDFRIQIDHIEYLELMDKIVQKTKNNLIQFLKNLNKLKTFHIKRINLGKIIEAYLAIFFKEIFGEFELIKRCLEKEKYDKIILFNCNVNCLDFFRMLEPDFNKIEFCNAKIHSLIRKITIYFRFKHFFPITLTGLIYYLKKKSSHEKIPPKLNIPTITFMANTQNQRHSIKALYEYYRKRNDIQAVISHNQWYLFTIKKINDLLKVNLKIKRIWKKDLDTITQGINYNNMNLKNLFNEFYMSHLFYFITRIYISLYYFSRHVKKTRSSIVTVGNDLSIDGRLNAKFCKLNQIPVVYIPHANISVWDEIVTKTDFSYIAVPGRIGKEYEISRGENPNTTIITGRPRYDSFYKGKINPLKEIKDMFTNRIYSFDPNKFTILLASNPVGNKAIEKTFYTVVESLQNLGLLENLIVKLHPRENGQIYRKMTKDLEINPPILRDCNILELIQSSQLLLTGISNTIMESMIIGTPVICMDFTNVPFYNNGKYLFTNEKYILISQNQEMLVKNLEKLTREDIFYQQYSKKLKKLSREFSYYDEKRAATEIIGNLFDRIIENMKGFKTDHINQLY